MTFRLVCVLCGALVIALVLHPTPASAQARTSIVPLGTLGGTQSQATAINTSAQVTGSSFITGNTAQHAFRYTNGAMQDLGTLGGTSSFGNGISADGQVTGNANLTGNSVSHAFLYSGGTMKDLGTLSGTGFSNGEGISPNGRFVTGEAASSQNNRAFLYTNGAMQNLGTLGGTFSFGTAVNDSGQVTGGSDITGSSAVHAMVYSNGSMRDIGILGAGTYATGTAINAAGQVAGWSYVSGNTGAQHAFLYSGAGLQDLGTLGGATSTAAGLNASGQVVGQSTNSAGSGHAFIYANGAMSDLNALAPGWILFSATGINDRAQITGTGQNNFQVRGYVLTLHPDWQGGNGYWDDPSHWNFAGLGSLGITPSAPHDVIINPSGSATIFGGFDASVSGLRMGGAPGQVVTLNLAGGTTQTANGTLIDANAVLAGSGRLGGDLTVNPGGRVTIGAGESMQLTGGQVLNNGSIRVVGTGASAANLEIGSATFNDANGQLVVQNGNASFVGSLVNVGQLTLQNANASLVSSGSNFGQLNLQSANLSTLGFANSGQINVTFGTSSVAGAVTNSTGARIIVSNGAQVSFFDRLANNGELRVSTGGAANLFGLVTGAGSFTGGGAVRFEGGFSPGNSPALVTVNTVTSFSSSSPIMMELAGTTPGTGYDKIIFTNAVTLEGGDLDVLWYGGWTGSAGDRYDLFDWNSTLTGTFGHVLLPTLASGLSWDIAGLYTTGEIGILGPVPEPETYAMLLAGIGLLGFVGRRRRAMTKGRTS